MRIFISALLLAVLAGPASALTSESTNVDGGVTLRANVSMGQIVDPGDRVSFQAQSARTGAMVLFDIDTQGYVSLLTDEPISVRAHDIHTIPGEGSELLAEGSPGIEFVFALAVSDPDAINMEAFSGLREGTRRINGDPFVAANMLTAELVSNVTQHQVFMGYTYFYVSSRVDYPCYLCGTCDGSAAGSACDGYQVVQNFDRKVALSYPLARGYDMIDLAQTDVPDSSSDAATPAIPDNSDVVSFYPYGSQVYYATPVALNAWYSWGLYDPFYYYYPSCYPYYSPWSFSIGFGWGWGGWGCGYGGYYCSGWYSPWYGCGYYPGCGGYYPSHPYYGTVTKFKSAYKSPHTASTLAENRVYASRHDGSLRVASKTVRTSTNPAYRSKNLYASSPFAAGNHRVKTSISGGAGSVAHGAWAQGRTGTGYKGGVAYRSKGYSGYYPRTGTGRTTVQRGYSKPYTGSINSPTWSGNTRVKNGYPSNGVPYGYRNGMGQSSHGTSRSWGNWSGSRGGFKSYGGTRSMSSYRGGWGGSHAGSHSFSGGGRGKGR
ncbi:MAG TPA: hypothetical protein VFH88_11115 [Candidatus Krumholzibacteria bacterium]|nr:hypothetical protein [Candidatus Krumholzibacteria bacterium]